MSSTNSTTAKDEEEPIPVFIPASIPTIAGTVDTLRKTFHSGRTRDLNFRLTQLKRLYWALLDVESIAIRALSNDLGRAHFESFFADISFTKSELLLVIRNLKRWITDEPVVEGIPWYLRFAHNAYLRKDPLGVVLIIGPWNYPWNLNLVPMIGAIAAGNTVLLKPSEAAPATAMVLQRLFEARGIDRECYRVVQGGVEETTEVLRQKFDKICYTGNGTVGKIVMRAAAEYLTPVMLELGGKNPTIVSRTANIPLTAKRLAWSKVLNCGQSCTAPDYVLIPSDLEATFLTSLRSSLLSFFPQGIRETKDYSRIVNTRHFTRIQNLLASTTGTVTLGGEIIDPDNLLMELTCVNLGHVTRDQPRWEKDPLMQDEIFGPVLAYITYDDFDDALEVVRKYSDTSLGCYIFSQDKREVDKMLNCTRSGGFCVNESFLNTVIAGLPFGGVGQSGMGCYRGRYSVDAFVHKRPVLGNKGGWVDWLIGFRFPPFTDSNYSVVKMAGGKPSFRREDMAKL